MKVAGGIVGLTQNEKALERFFLTAPHLSKIVADFEKKFGLESRKNMDKHHDLVGSKSMRICDNVEKLCTVIKEHGDPFESTEDRLFNIFTHAFVAVDVESAILKRDEIGQKAFEDFVLRFDGSESVWSQLKKLKLPSFKSGNKTVNITLEKGKVVALKEERNLFQRFIIIARSRPELNLEDCIGEFEFGVVPRSLFSADGSLLPTRDKHKVSNFIISNVDRIIDERRDEEDVDSHVTSDVAVEKMNDDTMVWDESAPLPKVILLDGMAVVNSLPKDLTKPLKTCADLAELFINQLEKKCIGYTDVFFYFFIDTSWTL